MSDAKKIDIFIVGTQKSGTTSLFHYLGQHPDIAPAKTTELDVSQDNYKKYIPRTNSAVLGKHASAIYRIANIKKLHRINNKIKIIVIMRNPYTRIYSAYNYARRRGWELDNNFNSILTRDETNLPIDLQYVNNSRYSNHIKTLETIFDKKDIFYASTESLQEDPLILCNRIFSWLQLPSNLQIDTSVHYNVGVKERAQLFSKLLHIVLFKRISLLTRITNIFPETIIHKVKTLLKNINTSQVPNEAISQENLQSLQLHLRDEYKFYRKFFQMKDQS